MNPLLRYLLPVAAVAFLTASPAKAAFMFIDDFSREGTIRFTLNDFEGGFRINGVLVQQGLNNPVTFDVPENGVPITFSASWITGGLVPTTNTVAFIEAGGGTTASDILQYTYSGGGLGGNLTGSFLSDVEGGPGLTIPPGAQLFLESQGAFVFSNGNITASAQSDAADAVPEPATLAVFGLMAAGAFGVRRRLKATA